MDDDETFDNVTRLAALGIPRRRAVKLISATLVAGAIPTLAGRDEARAQLANCVNTISPGFFNNCRFECSSALACVGKAIGAACGGGRVCTGICGNVFTGSACCGCSPPPPPPFLTTTTTNGPPTGPPTGPPQSTACATLLALAGRFPFLSSLLLSIATLLGCRTTSP